MLADIICIGNELLTGLVENSNTGFISRRLWSLGIPVRESSTVADDRIAIRAALERAREKSDLIIITGGLGPTEDDLTRESVAEILELPLIENQKWLKRLETFFNDRGLKMPANNRKQALYIKGSTILENKYGTAPGMVIKKEGIITILLPGPPHELQYMFDHGVLPVLNSSNREGELTRVKTLKVFGLGESVLEEKIKELGKWKLPGISYVAKGYEVDLQIKGSGDSDTAGDSIEEAERLLRGLLGDYIFGSDDDTLAGIVARRLVEHKMTLSVIESCSGGLLSDIITDIPGSSEFFLGGIVAYSRSAKQNLAGIKPEILEIEGEVSEATAKLMADGSRRLFRTDFGIGITGIAGPDSDSSGKPVGLVYIAVSSRKDCQCTQLKFTGGRRAVKERASQVALNILKNTINDTVKPENRSIKN